jgi:GDPmannose 4,6-dehydratase
VLSALGHEIKEICNIKGEKKVRNPLESTELKIGNATIQSNVIDQMLLSNSLSFDLDDVGLNIVTNKRKFKVEFDPNKFRPSDVPVLMSNINKVKKVGFTIKRDLLDIVNDQINYYLDPVNRKNLLAD